MTSPGMRCFDINRLVETEVGGVFIGGKSTHTQKANISMQLFKSHKKEKWSGIKVRS